MIKKNYLKPETAQTVVICDHALLAGSFKFNDEEGTGTGSLEDDEAVGEALSRRGSVWDED